MRKTNYNKSTDIPVILAEWCFQARKIIGTPRLLCAAGAGKEGGTRPLFCGKKTKKKGKRGMKQLKRFVALALSGAMLLPTVAFAAGNEDGSSEIVYSDTTVTCDGITFQREQEGV